jgi:endonuclease/exonuclease/phosphatase family metal-dependent hydrolase
MTSNLLHERVDNSRFEAVLDLYSPDVVVTQELAPGPAEILASRYPNHELHPSLDFTGRGIATRFGVEFGSIDMPGRDGTSALLDVAGVEVRLAGVHLLNPISFPWWVAGRSRARQLDGLFRWIDEADGPLVVAGDFNASPIWPAYRRMVGRLTDLVVEHDPAAEPTWAWRPGWPRVLRIDHVFGSGVVAKEVCVETIKGTDHAALIVDIEFLG